MHGGKPYSCVLAGVTGACWQWEDVQAVTEARVWLQQGMVTQLGTRREAGLL